MDRFCDPGCRTDSDCRDGESCRNQQCLCKEGFVAKNGKCVDVDECKAGGQICPPPTRCVNTPGSYTCNCPADHVRDPVRGCISPDWCQSDKECSDTLACLPAPGRTDLKKKCLNPCDVSFCTKKATCSVVGHRAFCSCPPRHRGDPTDAAIGCYPVECEGDQDCPQDRFCHAESLRCNGELMLFAVNYFLFLWQGYELFYAGILFQPATEYVFVTEHYKLLRVREIKSP